MREPKEILINGKTLEKILENHKHWLNKDVDEWKNMCADLSGTDLRCANLSGAYLRGAHLSGTDLRGAHLSCAHLSGTDLRGAHLRDAHLSGADLRYADLSGTDLSGAYLSGADLSGTDLSGADLSGTDLRGAHLSGTDLSGADLNSADLRYAHLRGAYLRGAHLSGADLRGAHLSGAHLRGAYLSGADLDKEEQIRKGVKLSNSITGWKKCKDGVIVKLEIPRGAIVFSINNDKCRTDKAIVKEIFGADRAFSMHKYFSYYVGDKIEVYNFNCEYNTECAEGIHFFRTRNEAENYNY